jgi:CCR4-NOT transcription complex subunit 6
MYFETLHVIDLRSSWLQVYSGNTNTIDGCATFFRRDRFSHVKKYEVWNCLARIIALYSSPTF